MINNKNLETKFFGFLSVILGILAIILSFSFSIYAPFLQWLVLVIGIVACVTGIILFSSKNLHIPSLLSKILLPILLSFLIVVFTNLVDRIIGRSSSKKNIELIFKAGSSAIYQTSEFSYVAKINSLGFRDYDYPLNKQGHFRIIVLGDSFTFGWGNELEDTWVKILEKSLQKKYASIEVLNLGRGGGFPKTYSEIAEKAIPILNPNLVVIAVPQGEDLFQSIQSEETHQTPKRRLKKALVSIAQLLYPNFVRLYRLDKANPININLNWKETSKNLYKSLDTEQKIRFSQLSPDIQEMFFTGNINPSLIKNSTGTPWFFIEMEDLESERVRNGINAMTVAFLRIKRFSKTGGEQRHL